MNEQQISQFTTKIDDYQPIVGKSVIDELKLLGNYLAKRKVLNINSTFTGGGVAEILTRMVPLLNQLGLDARWEVIHGSEAFFDVTKKFHNTLHGRSEDITGEDFDIYMSTIKQNILDMKLESEIFYIHDPQPAALISQKDKVGGKWIWRCHIDVSHPDQKVWDFLKQFVAGYDAAVFSAPSFSPKLPVRQFLISPSIDPLSEKNKDLTKEQVEKVLDKFKLDLDKPMIVQISRFDYLKDPIGVIQAFEMVRKGIDCQLVLAGGTATDDPESAKVLDIVNERASGNPDIKVILIPPGSDIEINALQRAATVVLQKSLKEGFGLTISEALWKGRPVVASAVGGIPLQIQDKFTGLLCHSIEGAAFALKQVLSNPELASRLGRNGREHVKQNFLITRHLKEYMLLFIALYINSEVIYI